MKMDENGEASRDLSSFREAVSNPCCMTHSTPLISGRVTHAGCTPELSLLLTVEEAAALLRLGRTRTFDLVMRGEIQSVKVGRRRLVVREGLSRYVSVLLEAQAGG